MFKTISLIRINRIISILILFVLTGSFFVTHSRAADLTTLSDTLSRLKASVDSNHTITFTTPGGVAAGETIEITFPSDFSTASVDYTDIDFSDDGANLALAAVPNTTTWGAAFGGENDRTLTLTSGSGTITASSVITIEIGTNADFGTIVGDLIGDRAINNPNTNNTYLISIAGTFGDIGSIPVVIIADDQVQVSADIYTTLEFLVSAHSVGFGTITNNNVRYATADGAGAFTEPSNGQPVKLTAGTNAQNGLTIYIQGKGNNTNAGLYASLISELIPAAPSTKVIDNSNKYGVYGKNAANLTLSKNFDNDDNDVEDLAISTLPQILASSPSQVNGTIDLSLVVATDPATKPGNYADTLTVNCTGQF